MDLVLKQVIRTFEVQKQANKRDPIRTFKYVETGKNFLVYEPLTHEKLFLSPFSDNNSQILFRHIVNMGYQNAKTEKKLHSKIIQNSQLANCFKIDFIQSIFGGFTVTKKGSDLRKKVEKEIEQLEQELPSLISNDQPKALEILKVIKGNIFLLKNIEFDMLKQLDRELLEEMNKREGNRNDTGCGGCTWNSFDNYSESFDNGCSGDTGCIGGDSGCRGSGCSGCSGCGGCGGCS